MDRITAKDAVRIATDYFQSVTGKFGIRIIPEEVELDGGVWAITLSYPSDYTGGAIYTFEGAKKEYKVLRIDSENGEVLSMKIKE